MLQLALINLGITLECNMHSFEKVFAYEVTGIRVALKGTLWLWEKKVPIEYPVELILDCRLKGKSGQEKFLW